MVALRFRLLPAPSLPLTPIGGAAFLSMILLGVDDFGSKAWRVLRPGNVPEHLGNDKRLLKG